jgi:hypothetical protein
MPRAYVEPEPSKWDYASDTGSPSEWLVAWESAVEYDALLRFLAVVSFALDLRVEDLIIALARARS